jgi:hypothetical protein
LATFSPFFFIFSKKIQKSFNQPAFSIVYYIYIKKGWQTMTEAKANREYKDSVFTSLFSDEKLCLELYNALEGTEYKDVKLIFINTLTDVLYMNRQNDISFAIGDKILILIEHQSTINENIAIRMLFYIARIYEKIIEGENEYKRSMFKLPKPEFIVLYNGKDPYPKEKFLKLSDAFRENGVNNVDEKINSLDLTVRVININKGCNPEIERKSETLAGYATFVAKVRECQKAGHPLAEAVKLSVQHCMERGILKDYLKQHSSEVINMLDSEFSMETALKVARQEGMEMGIERGIERGHERGRKEGRQEGIEEGHEKHKAYVLKLLKQGLTLEEIEEKINEEEPPRH